MKKIIIIGLLSFCLILIINFIYNSYSLNIFDYGLINDNSENFSLFKENEQKKIRLNFAIGNSNEQIYFYKYSEDYDLTIWKIKGYNDANLLQTHMYLIDNFEEISINPQRINDLGYIQFISKIDTLNTNKLLMYSNNNAKILNHFETKTFAYLNIISDGVILAQNEEDFHIKLSSVNSSCFNIAFIKYKNEFYFITLTKKDNLNMKDNILLDILSFIQPRYAKFATSTKLTEVQLFKFGRIFFSVKYGNNI